MSQIKHSISIDAPLESVYPLVSAAAGFTEWWAADVNEDAVAKAVDLGFFNRATVYRLRPVRLEAPQHAEWLCESGKEWKGTKLIFSLRPDRGKTLVQFSHADWQAETDYFVSCTTTWGGLMFRLKAAAEGKSCGPLFSRDGMGY